jgi:hypothetical protein
MGVFEHIFERVDASLGDARSRLFIEIAYESRLILPVSPSPTPPTTTRLRLPKQKQNKKKSSPGLSNRPCGPGPTAHLSIYTRTHTEAERIPVIYNQNNNRRLA